VRVGKIAGERDCPILKSAVLEESRRKDAETVTNPSLLKLTLLLSGFSGEG
jgi:hypothetical protein